MKPKTKVCRDCGKRKALEEFSPMSGGKYGRNSYCRPCYNVRKRAWRLKHADRLRVEERARNGYKREHERKNRQPCPKCGELMGPGSGYPSHNRNACQSCYQAERAERTAERDRELERLWAAGKTLREIGAHFNWTRGHIAQEFSRARARGADLPFRRPPRDPSTDRRFKAAA